MEVGKVRKSVLPLRSTPGGRNTRFYRLQLSPKRTTQTRVWGPISMSVKTNWKAKLIVNNCGPYFLFPIAEQDTREKRFLNCLISQFVNSKHEELVSPQSTIMASPLLKCILLENLKTQRRKTNYRLLLSTEVPGRDFSLSPIVVFFLFPPKIEITRLSQIK